MIKNGLISEYYGNGNKKFDHNYMNNKKHGLFTNYYIDGTKESECTYFNNKINGSYISYYKNGNIRENYSYKNNKMNGLCLEYYKNGNLSESYNYKNDLEHGTCIDYYDNGIISQNYCYKNGNKCKLCIDYYDNGDIHKEYKYVKNNKEVDCIVKEYHKNIKNHCLEKTIKNERTHGKLETYYGDGNKCTTVWYKDGIIHGKFIKYNKDELIRLELGYTNGNLDYNTMFYNTGNVGAKKIFKNNIEKCNVLYNKNKYRKIVYDDKQVLYYKNKKILFY